MDDLSFKKTPSGWGLEAVTKTGEILTCSIPSNKQQAKMEYIWLGAEKTGKILLWLLLISAFVALAANLYFFGYKQHNLFFLTAKSPANLIIGFGVLGLMYLWAQNNNQQITSREKNLIFWQDHASTHPQSLADVADYFDLQSRNVFRQLIKRYDDPKYISSFSLVLQLLKTPQISRMFTRLSANPNDIAVLLTNFNKLNLPNTRDIDLIKLPFLAFIQAEGTHNKYIDPPAIFCALVRNLPPEHFLRSILFNLDADIEKLENVASWLSQVELLREEFKFFKKLSKYKPDNGINRGLTAIPTFYLDKYSQDLTLLAKHGRIPVSLGRQADLKEIFSHLKSGRQNLLIKGQEGSGRTALIYEFAYKMAAEQTPPILADKRLVALKIAEILGNREKSETAFMQALREAENSGNIILVIEELEKLALMKTGQGISLLELLISFLQNSSLIVIATTNDEAYQSLLKPSANFEEIFTAFDLLPLSRNQLLLAACIKASLLEGHLNCYFPYQSIELALDLSDKYIKGPVQPQKTIAILNQAASNGIEKKNLRIITPDKIRQTVAVLSHIPIEAVSQNDSEKLLRLEEILSKSIIGQTQAVKAVSDALRRSKSGLSPQNRPMASFLFLGPTGVGKTELAKTLAREIFNDPKCFLRLDMSEFRGQEGLNKFIGSANNKTDTSIVIHIKNYPYCLLLLDEFEKASREIHNLFLQILDDGRITTGRGEVLDLTQSLIIATSNAGSLDILNGLNAHKSMDQIKAKLLNASLTEFFLPELLNRFDGIIIFQPLSPNELEQIAWMQLQNLSSDLYKKGLKISFTPQVAKNLAEKGFDPALGARPLRRYLQNSVEDFIATLILSKKLRKGDEAVVDYQNNGFTLF